MNIHLNPEAAHTIITVAVSLTLYAGMEFLRRLAIMRKEYRRRADLDNRWHDLAKRQIENGRSCKWSVEEGKDNFSTQ